MATEVLHAELVMKIYTTPFSTNKSTRHNWVETMMLAAKGHLIVVCQTVQMNRRGKFIQHDIHCVGAFAWKHSFILTR